MMGDRIIEVSSDGCLIRTTHHQLVIEQHGEVIGTVPIEDMAALSIDNPSAIITHAAIRELAKQGVILVSSDERHQPVGMLLPLHAHTTQTERFAAQANLRPTRHRAMWKTVVRAKIRAQARTLKQCTGSDGGLLALSNRVRSGDQGNLEAQAARRYWQRLFTASDFRRDVDAEDQNRYLNYGYAILRSLVARTLCAAGLHPSIGIHHRNRYNPFCLADDIMEPYRPTIDRIAHRVVEEHGSGAEMTREIRRALLGVMESHHRMGERTLTLSHAVRESVNSLVTSIMENRNALAFPSS